jgi:hypothetical protein
MGPHGFKRDPDHVHWLHNVVAADLSGSGGGGGQKGLSDAPRRTRIHSTDTASAECNINELFTLRALCLAVQLLDVHLRIEFALGFVDLSRAR